MGIAGRVNYNAIVCAVGGLYVIYDFAFVIRLKMGDFDIQFVCCILNQF